MNRFRIACAAQASIMIVICLIGLTAPHTAMSEMTGMDRPWDPSTLSLMRMQTGSDLVLVAGFLLIAFRPVASFSAFVLCLASSLGHGILHLRLAAEAGLSRELLMISVLVVGPLVLASLYPFRSALLFYGQQETSVNLGHWMVRCACLAMGSIMLGIGVFGLVDAPRAMSLMAGQSHDWHAATLSLMRMHTASDAGLGIGLFVAAYRPNASFPALVLASLATIAHAAVHFLEELEGFHPSDNASPLLVLGAILFLLLAATPWRRYYARYRISNSP
jgi:hypothetical protein